MNTKEIAKKIRTDLKSMKGFKFSVRTELFAGGSAINVDVMVSPIRMIRTMDEIPNVEENSQFGNDYTMKNITKRQSEKYHQINYYQLRDEWDERYWNNGVFLTPEGHESLKKINEIITGYHWDESDSSVDYFNCNFYYHISLGKWDKDFIDGK